VVVCGSRSLELVTFGETRGSVHDMLWCFVREKRVPTKNGTDFTEIPKRVKLG
jgi:hypothetical protein